MKSLLGSMSLTALEHVAVGFPVFLHATQPSPLQSLPPADVAAFLDALLLEASRKLATMTVCRSHGGGGGGGGGGGISSGGGGGRDESSCAGVWSAVVDVYTRERRLLEAPTGLICELLKTCARWGVLFPEEHLEALEYTLERRRRELLSSAAAAAAAAVTGLAATAPEQQALPRAQQRPAAATATAAGAISPTGHSCDVSLKNTALICTASQLREGVLLPLARLRQGLKNPDIYLRDLVEWFDEGFEGLDERIACDLLGLFADRPAWAAAPGFRQAVLDLLVRTLSQRSSHPAKMSSMILAASRALRVFTDSGTKRPTGISVLDVTDPRIAVLVLPAVKHLLDLNPSAENIADAAQALFVELEWRGNPENLNPIITTATNNTAAGPNDGLSAGNSSPPSPPVSAQSSETSGSALSESPDSYQVGLSGGGCGWPSSELSLTRNRIQQTQLQVSGLMEAKALLACMWEAAVPSLVGCRAASLAALLAACTVIRYRPTSAWLAQLFNAATVALSVETGFEIATVHSFVQSMSQMEGWGLAVDAGECGDTTATGTRTATLDGNDSSSGGDDAAIMVTEYERLGCLGRMTTEDPAYVTAKGMLLDTLGNILLKDTAVLTWFQEPEHLVLFTRQLAALGLQPQASWLSKFTRIIQGLLGSMSLASLAHVAEALALMRVTLPLPPLSSSASSTDVVGVAASITPTTFLDALLLEASQKLEESSTPHDMLHLGLLVGAVHAMLCNARRRAETLGRSPDGDHQHQPHQQDLLSSASRMQPLLLSDAARLVWDRMRTQLKVHARKDCGLLARYQQPVQLPLVVSALVHSMRSTPADWLHSCALTLLRRREAVKGDASTSAAASNTYLPFSPAPMLADLLRLASYVMYGRRRDCGIVQIPTIPPAATLTSPIISPPVQSRTDDGPEHAAAALVLDYVHKALLDIASHAANRAAADANTKLNDDPLCDVPSRDEWIDLLRAVMASGVRFKPSELTLLFVAVTRGAHWLVATAAAATPPPERQLLRDAWAYLEVGLREVLVPVLPQTPTAPLLRQLREGFLESSITPVALEQASWRQLGQLCTYGLQVGSQLLPPSWWRQLHVEVARRQLLQQTMPVDDGSSRTAARKQLSGCYADCGSDGVEVEEFLDPWDVASVCYNLEVCGCSVPEADLLMLRRSLGASPVGGTAASPFPSTTAGPPGIGADVSWCHGSLGTDPDSVLRALHLLWVARQFGFLSNVPTSVWDAVYGSGTSEQPVLLALLQPQQLGQLVMLRAEQMRASAASIGSRSSGNGKGTGVGVGGSPAPARQQDATLTRPWNLPDWFTSSWLELLVDICCNPPRRQHQQDGFLKDGEQAELPPLQRPLEPLVAALAVCYCLPRSSTSSNGSSSGSSSIALQRRAAALVERALPALESALPLLDIPAFLEALERRALPLPQQHLHVLVTRLTASKRADGPPVERLSSDRKIESGSQDPGGVTDLTQLAPVQAIRVVRSSVIAAAGHPGGAVTPVLPLLSALMQLLGSSCNQQEEEQKPLTPSMTARVTLQSSPSLPLTPHHARQLLRTHSSGPNDARHTATHLGCLADVPPAELARLAAVLIDAGHDTPLPPPAAAVVLRLISLGDDVIRLVSSSLLERALRHSLAFTGNAAFTSAAVSGGGNKDGDFIPLPLSDAVYTALVQRLRPYVELCELLARLRRLGGSEEQTQRALLSCLPDDASVNELSLRTVLGLLQQLADSGVRERRGITLRCRLDALITRRTSGGSSTIRRSNSGVGDGEAEMVHRNISVSLLGDKGGAGAGGGDAGGAGASNGVERAGEFMHVRGSGRRRRRSSSSSNLDGPYAGLTTRLVKRLATLGKTDCLPLEDATEVLQLLAVLMRRLEGLLACEDFWRSVYGICSSVARQEMLGRHVADKPAQLFQFLEAAHELGGAHCNEMVFRASHRADYLPLVGQVLLRGDAMRIAVWAAELSRDAWAASRAHHQAKVRLGLQPDRLSTYPISLTGVQNLAEVIRPLVEAHLAAITEEEEERDTAETRRATLGVGSGKAAGKDMGLALTDRAAASIAGSREDEGVSCGCGEVPAESQAVAEAGGTADSRVLSARQLGLVFGLLFFQFHALPAAAQELAVMTHLALAPLVANLAHRAKDMNPLEHLIAVLDALEPIAQDTGDLHTNFDDLFQISAMLASPLCRILAMTIEDIASGAVGDEPLPLGLDPWDDAILLRSPFDISEDSLMEGLFLPHPGDAVTAVVTAMETGAATGRAPLPAAPATATAAVVRTIPTPSSSAAISKFRRISSARVRSAVGPVAGGSDGTATLVFEGSPPKVVAADIAGVRCVPNLKLPAALRPPPGRRHGMPGDAAGDAAREAYMRAAAPWLIAGRRIARLLRSNRQRNTLVTALELRGLVHIGPGRWATALGLLAHPQRTVEAMITRGVITQEQAKALVGIMCDTASTLCCDSGDEPMQLVKQVSQELPKGLRSQLRGIGACATASVNAGAGVRIGISGVDGSASTSGERNVSSAAGLTARISRSGSLSRRRLEDAASKEAPVARPLSGASSMGHPRRTEAADQRQHHMHQSRSDAAALLERALATGLLPSALSSRGSRRRLQAALTPLFTALEAPPSPPRDAHGEERIGDASRNSSTNTKNNKSLVMVQALAALINEKVPANVANAAIQQVEHLRESVAEGTPVEVAKLLLLTDVVALLEASIVVKVSEEKRAKGSATRAPGSARC
ncbi:hypothetical protein Vafri_14388 [Volvox africanus]|nr:hypothetical protein Vafri_14388 [Volvox africanus]